jgi:hypothetical protein
VPEKEDEVGGDVIRPEDGDLVVVGVRDRVLTHRHVQQRTRTNHLRQSVNKKPFLKSQLIFLKAYYIYI